MSYQLLSVNTNILVLIVDSVSLSLSVSTWLRSSCRHGQKSNVGSISQPDRAVSAGLMHGSFLLENVVLCSFCVCQRNLTTMFYQIN